MNPIVALFKSRKFMLLLFDTVISLALFFTGKYLAPPVFEDVKFAIVALQPIFIAVIAGITVEDAAAKLHG